MRVIIAGSRQGVELRHIEAAMEYALTRWQAPAVVISGACPRGADAAGEAWASARGIPVERYPADWAKHGRAAGPRRNRDMAQVADALLAVRCGDTPGTRNMIAEARRKSLWVIVMNVVPDEHPARIDRFSGQYEWLSNFHPARVKFEDAHYPSAEHAYQAAKLAEPSRRRPFQAPTMTAGQAKRIGRKVQLRPGWTELYRVQVMAEVLRNKFTIGTPLAALLVGTGSTELVEGNTWGDTYWGVCRGEGENRLGKLLMAIREELHTGLRTTEETSP